jgi:hypothetical protein
LRFRLWRIIRYTEILVVSVLAVFAVLTYRELLALRRVPVALPNYEFEAADDPQKGRVVRSRGTWIAEFGPPEPLQTTTIECRKSTMQCVESAATVVFVGDRGVMESVQMVFDVDRWTDAEVVSKPAAGRCASRTLVLDLVNKHARSQVSAAEEKGVCKARPAGTLDLVTGFRIREALQKAGRE